METLTKELRMTAEETSYRSKKFSDFRTIPTWECTCSSCGNPISQDLRSFNSHPVLGILQCQPCADQFRLFQSSVDDEDTVKSHCLICARNNPSSIYTCTGRSCNFSFCKRCIKRNAANTLLVCEKSDWRCFVCNTKPLWQRRGVCAAMMSSNTRRSKKKVSRHRFNDSNESSEEESTTQSKKNENEQSIQSSSRLSKHKKTVEKNENVVLVSSSSDDDFTDEKIIKPTPINSKKITSTQINSKKITSTQINSKKITSTQINSKKINSKKINSTQVNEKKKLKSSNNEIKKKKITEPLKKSLGTRQNNLPRVEALTRMNSDSSSGKEFTQTKILKDSYIPLQKLESINENIPSAMESNVLSKTEALNLKTTTQKYFDDLAAVSRKLLNDIETAKKFYMKKDSIKPIDATQFIVECKNIACSLIKRTEANEKKLINQYSKWCKRTKVKNIFNNTIKNSQQIRKRSVSGTKERLSSSSSSSSSSDEEDEKKEETVVKKTIERELEVSECDSEQIFSEYETKKTKQASKFSSTDDKNKTKQNLETSGIETDSNENNSDIEAVFFSPQAGTSSLMKNSNSKQAEKSDESMEDIPVKMTPPVSRTKKITNISDDSAEDEVFSSPDLKKRKSNIISQESKKEAKTKKGIRRNIEKEREERVKAKLANSTSDSSDGEKTEFKVSHQAKKNKEIILNGISDSDDDGMTVEKTAKKNLPQTFDSSEDEEAELPTSGAEKIITNGVSDSEDTTDNTVGGNKKNSRKDGNSPKKSNGDKNAENQEKEAMDKIDSDSTDVDESAPKRPDLISDVSEGEATEPEDSKANKITKKNSGLKNKEKQKPASQQIDSDSTDVDESAPKKPGVISDASEGEATEPEASAINKLSKKNSDLENKKKQNKNMNKIDSDSTDVDESAPKKTGVISDASEGEATEPEVSTTNKLSRKTSDLENKKKQKKDLNKIDSDSTDVDESVPKKPEVILDSSENKTTERETTKNSKKLLKNSADSEASTDVDETLSKKSKNPTESLDHDETESLQAPATDNSSSDQEEWADAEDIAGRKLHSRNSDSTEYEEFEPAPSNNSKEKEQLSSENSENSDDEDGGPEKNELNNKETSNSVSKKTSSDPKSSDAEETVDKEEKLRKKLLEIDSSDEDDEQDSNVNETDKTIEHSYSKRKKNSSSQSSRNNSDSDSPKQKKKKLRPDNEENMKKKLLVSSSESDEEVDESSKNGNESPKQSAGNSQLDNEDNMKKKLLGSSSESDEEVDKSSKNGSESPKQSKENSQLDNEENMKKKLLGSSSESDEEAKKSGDSQASKNGSKSPKQSKGNSQLDNEENMKKKLLGSSSESDEVDKSSKNGSESPKQSKKNSHLNNEENMKKKLLGSSSESDEEAEKSDEDKSSNEKKKNNITALKDSFLRSRLSKKFRIKNNRYYKSDAKLRSKCMVKVQRIPPRNLRKHAKALKKSKEYVENKKLQSLIALDDLEKNRNRDRQMNSSSEEEETSTSTRNRRKKTAKESEETLMDHLKNLNNGDTMDVDDSASEDEEEPQNLPTINEEVTDLDEAADKIAQNNLLRDSESNSEEEAQDSDAEEEEEPKAKKESKKKSKPTVSSKNDSDIEMENEEEVKEGNKGKDDKGRWRRNALLTTNFSSSDSDEQAAKVEKKSSKLKSSQELEAGSDDETEKIKKNRIRRQRFNSDSDVKMTDLSSNSENDEEKLTKSDNEKSKKKRPRRKKGNDSSDSDLSSTKRGKQKAKRRRIKTADTESDDDDGSSVEEMNNSQGTPGKSGRKNIRRVLKDTKVADDTKQAAMQEEERLKRMSERQKIYNEMYEVRLAGEKKVDNLVLDFDEESKEELLSVHENLVKKLKPHQAQGIKFMWDACFESLERAKTTVGSGAILAHCMGLGKSFQIVTLSHTLLANYEKTNVKTVMVVCPLSTVLNWVNEFKIWLKEINDDEDEIEIYEMTKMKKNFERKYVLEEWQKKGGVLIIGYEMFRNLSSGAKKVTKKIRESFSRCLVDPGPDLVVCDEGHLLKSENTAISKAMSKIKTLRRIVLTGTPLQNNLIEYHCMVQFVKPNLLGTKKEFLNRFVNPINNGQFDDSTEYDVKLMKKRAHVLHKMLEGSVQRFDYSVLTPFLPPKQEYVIFIKLTEVQVKLYQYYIENLARRHRAAGGSLFADFQALQRIWTHPICIKLNADKDADRKRRNNDTDSEGSLKDFIDDDDDSDNSSSSVRSVSSISGSEGGRQRKNFKSTKSTRSNPLAEESIEEPQPDPEWWSQFVEEDHFEDMRISSKLLLLFDILKESENIGDKVLVFSQSLYSLTLIEKFLAMLDDETQKGVTSDYLDGHTGRWRLGLDYFRLDGGSSTENRSEWCKIFNRPTNTRARLFLISTRAGGLGINLTAANRVIIFDASWNPSHDVQSIFRIYRFGQKKPCYVYRLLAAGTMEEKIYNRQVTKLSLSCRVVDEQQIERHYSNNDLTELYKYEETTEETVSLALPKDRLLAEIFLRHKNLVRNYHEHDSLLENKAEEELDEEERKQAWREYEDEKAGRRQLGVPMMHYQDQMHQFNAQMMNQSISQLPEFEQIKQLIQKDYPTATPEQQMQITKQAMVNMYAFIENQHLMRNMQSPILTGRPPMQLPQAPMMNQISKPPNPTNTLANMLAQQEYARHHNTSSKKMSAQQKQIQYAQQFGNFRSVPVPSNARPAAAPTPQRSTNSEEPEIIELESPTVAPASTSNARKGKKKFQEE